MDTMPVMVCKGTNFAKKNSFLVVRIVLFDTAGLHLFTFRISEPWQFKNLALDLSHVISR